MRDRWCSGSRVCRLDDFGQPPSPRYRSGRAPTEWHLVHTTGIRCSMDFHPAYPELRQRNRWHRPSAIAAGLAAITSLAVTLATRDLRPSLPAQPDRISVRWLASALAVYQRRFRCSQGRARPTIIALSLSSLLPVIENAVTWLERCRMGCAKVRNGASSPIRHVVSHRLQSAETSRSPVMGRTSQTVNVDTNSN